MVRRLKANDDQRQLGLFGESLALGVKPKVAKVFPVCAPPAEAPRVATITKPSLIMIGEPLKRKSLALLTPEVVRPPEAASLLSVLLSLLKKWRLRGDGPRFVRLGGRAIGYRRVDLSDWVKGRTR